MSYKTWTIYGYGVCSTDIADKMYRMNDKVMKDDEKISRLDKLLNLAPNFKKEFYEWVEENNIGSTYTEYMDYEDFDTGYWGIGPIIQKIIKEHWDLYFTLCDDFDGRQFVVWEPSYPWEEYTKSHINLTTEKIQEVFNTITNILYDENIVCDYYSVENGG